MLDHLTIIIKSGLPRIGATVAILFVSLFAISFPGVSKQVPYLRIPHLVFFIGKHFGTGVILSTAFCHLLPDAFESLQDRGVNERYHGIGKWTGMIILGSLLSMFLVEYASTAYVDHLHAEPSAPPSPSSSPSSSRPASPSPTSIPPPTAQIRTHTLPASISIHPTTTTHSQPHQPLLTRTPTETTPLVQRSIKRARSLCSFHSDEPLLPLFLLSSPRLFYKRSVPHFPEAWGRVREHGHPGVIEEERGRDGSGGGDMGGEVSEEDPEGKTSPRVGRRRQVVGILVLQLGIMIHSLVIGLTLAVTSGTEFTSLVTAIIFHQLFEGLSLGIRIASLPPPPPPPPSSSHSPSVSAPPLSPRNRAWLAPTLAVLFAITTPFGMSLGALVFPSSGDGGPEQEARIRLTQGIMSGISAGMLIYASTVEMLAGDFVYGDVSGDVGFDHHHHHHHRTADDRIDSHSIRSHSIHAHSLRSHSHSLHDHTDDEYASDDEDGTISEIVGTRDLDGDGRGGGAVWRKVLAVGSLLVGAGVMAVVGMGE